MNLLYDARFYYKIVLNRMRYSTIMNIMAMTYPALKHQALYFFDYLPDFSQT